MLDRQSESATTISLVGAIALLGLSAAAPVSADDSAVRQLVDTLHDASDLATARESFERLPLTGAQRTLGVYAMSLHLTQAGKYQEAWDLLAGLTGSASTSVPALRLRLYLALELGEANAACSLLRSLARVLPTASLASSEIVLMSRQLGGLAGAVGEQSPASAADWLALERALGARNAGEHSLDHYRAAQKKAGQRKAELMKVWKGWESLEPERLMELRRDLSQELEQLSEELKAEEEHLKELNAIRRKEKENLGTLAAKYNKLTVNSDKPAPGRPSPPVPPRRGQGGDTLKYQNDVRSYEIQVVVFPRALELWAEKDRIRRELIARDLELVKPELDAAREQDKTAADELTAVRKKVASMRAQQGERAVALRLLKLVLADDAAKPDDVILRPSLYDSLSIEAEQQRLLQLIKR